MGRRLLAFATCPHAAAIGAAIALSAIGTVGRLPLRVLDAPGSQLGCSAKEAARSSQPDPVLVGVVMGTSGQLSSFSLPLKETLLVAEGQINGNGGVLGRSVRFTFFDDRSESNDILVKGVRDLVQTQKVLALIGPVGSGQVKAVHEIARAGQAILLAPSATSTELSTLEPLRDRWLFRTTPNDGLQAKAVVRFASGGAFTGGAGDAGTGVKCSKMAIVHIDNSYGVGMAEIVAKEWPPTGGSVVVKKQVTEAPVDKYTAEIDAIFAAKAECLVLVAYDDVGSRLVFQLKTDPRYTAAPDPKLVIIGTDGIFTQGFIDGALAPDGTSLAEGVYGTNPDTNPQTPEFAQFKNVYNAYYPGREPPSFGANTYDAAMLIALAIQRAGSLTNRVAIRDALYDVSKDGQPFGPAQYGEAVQAMLAGNNINYAGASGNVDIDDSGDTEGGFIVWKIQGKAVPKDGIGRYRAEDLARK